MAPGPGPEGKECDDGDKCTSGETCSGGTCGLTGNSGNFLCKCSPTKLDKCYQELGNDPCDGTVACDTSGSSPKCVQKEPVNCDTSKDSTCAANTCDSKTGKCAMTPAKDGTLCDDGDKCTQNDVCKAGKCTAGDVNTCK